MPLYGTLGIDTVAASAPVLDDFGTEPLELTGVTVLQVFFEIDSAATETVLPPALHPTNPPAAMVVFWSVPDSPWGAFRLALLRIACRAASKPRGYPVAGFVDSPAAAAGLADRWAYDLRVADVRLSAGHDRVRGVVELDGRVRLDVGLSRPEAISGSDLFFTSSMHPARTPRGPRLVQVDPDYVFHRAERGRPTLDVVDIGANGIGADRIGAGEIRPTWPVSASSTVCDIELPRLRYLCRLDEPASRGTERVE